MEQRERIAKRIARAGFCSRRGAEQLIAERRVSLAGEVLESPAVVVAEDAEILVDGAPLPPPEPPRLWRLNKPAGVITTARDPQGRKTVFDLLPAHLPRLLSIGRLDLNSEGLLLLTNDGALKRRLELPKSGYSRRYRVRVFGQVDAERLAALAEGISIDGIDYGPITARLESRRGANAWLGVTLHEGKKREVRRVCEHLNLQVSRLIRIGFGPFHLGKLAKGAVDELSRKVLREQLGGAPQVRKIGTAKAKPRPVKPARRAAQRRAKERAREQAKEPAKGPAREPAGKSGHADRRRPA